MTKTIHVIAYIGTILLFLSVISNVALHISYHSKISKDKSNDKENYLANDYTFMGIMIGFVMIISSELLKLIYGI